MEEKTVNLSKNLHKKLKKRAVEKDSTIKEELTTILENGLKEDNNNEWAG